jgi:hypothetical protein
MAYIRNGPGHNYCSRCEIYEPCFRVHSVPDDGEGRLTGTIYCHACLAPPDEGPCMTCRSITIRYTLAIHPQWPDLLTRIYKCEDCWKTLINSM